jgi:hypothetical protein
MQASAVIPGGQRISVTVDLSRQPKTHKQTYLKIEVILLN